MKISAWLAVLVMLSPWMWYYSRQLWDNSFCIPLSAMTIAAYADYLATRCGRSLSLSIFLRDRGAADAFDGAGAGGAAGGSFGGV